MSETLNSKLILGTVQMGLSYGINNTRGKVSLDDSLEIFEYAYDSGIRILDSAEAYGNAHEIIGIFHNKYPDKTFKVITKLPNKSNYDIPAKVENYLKELNVNQLETLMFHSYDSYQKNIEYSSDYKIVKFFQLKKLQLDIYNDHEKPYTHYSSSSIDGQSSLFLTDHNLPSYDHKLDRHLVLLKNLFVECS